MEIPARAATPIVPYARPAWRWAAAAIPLGLAIIVQWVAGVHEDLTERYFARIVYPHVQALLSNLNARVPFSLLEVTAVGLCAAAGAGFAWEAWRVCTGKVRLRAVMRGVAFHGLWAWGVLTLVFLALWGLNYERLPLAENLGLRQREPGRGERLRLSRFIIGQVNAAYEAAHPVGQQLSSGEPGFEELARAWDQVERTEAGSFLQARAPCRPKGLFFSGVMSRLGLGGVFNPFTGEASFNTWQPRFDLPFAVAHEEAHQRGIARESEANFMAFLVCTRSRDPVVRYSGWLGALGVVGSLRRPWPKAYRALVAELAPGPRADLKARAAFWKSYEGVLTVVGRTINNLYLESNRIRSGIHNYNEADTLIVEYLQTHPETGWRDVPLPDTAEPAPAAPDLPPVHRVHTPDDAPSGNGMNR